MRKSTLAQNRQTYTNMLLALREAISFAKANAEPTKAAIGKYTKADPGPALDEAYSAFQPYWQLGPVKLPDVQAVLQYSSNPAAASFNAASIIDNSIVDGLT